ncbi:MAG: OmpA family protein [Gammaproteobacteria bacterium]|nr:OmpA family protein [Gammaproteobacteria bacterium]
MKTRLFSVLMLLLAAGGLAAAPGYWTNTAGEIWRSGAGECWHTGFWSPQMSVVGCDGKIAEQAAAPAPPPPPPAAPPAVPALTSADATVNFGFDKADLDADAIAAIDTLVSAANARGSIQAVRLTGHADRIGTEEYNMDLSLRRASSVSDYLVQRAGVDPQAIEIGGRGESEPIVGCEGQRGGAAIRCLAPNRRVEVILDVSGR